MDISSQLCAQLLIDEIKKSTNDNIVLSPFSYNVILNMIAEGSTGPLLIQMLQILRCNEVKDLHFFTSVLMNIPADKNEEIGHGPVIRSLSGAWVDHHYRLEPSFEEFVRRVFEAEVKHVDFVNKADEIVQEANEWAKAATKGLVTDVLKPGDVTILTKLVLGNALYFKGTWEESFKSKSTKNMDFHLLNGGKVWVPFMTGCKKYSHNSFEDFDLVKIPYKRGEDGKEFSMYIFLPHERYGLGSLLDKVALDSNFFQQHFPLVEGYGYDKFWIPKFKFSYYTDQGLQKINQMGLHSMLGMEAINLGTRQKELLEVTKIVQKAFVEIDEMGTEAAAVTFAFVGFGSSASMISKKEFVADHPFMFMIREEQSKVVLFTGAVLNPLA